MASMTVGTGIGLLGAVIAIFAGVVYVWRQIPVYACPECFSYNVHEDEEVAGVHYCECGHSWREA